MSEPSSTHTVLGEALLQGIRQAVREEIRAVYGQNGHQDKISVETANPYLTVKEAAKLSRIGSSTIRLYIRKRELRACQVGSRVIIKRADLEKFLESRPIELFPD